MTYKRDKRSPVPKNEKVSYTMSRIGHKNTYPEIFVRKILWQNGYRGYRANHTKLPGKPDIAFTKRKIVIFINGCYWHGCEVCNWKVPKTNNTYWHTKIQNTKLRDERKKNQLEDLGYTVIYVWEHELKNQETLTLRLLDMLSKKSAD